MGKKSSTPDIGLLVGKYLDRRCTPAEQAELEDWLFCNRPDASFLLKKAGGNNDFKVSDIDPSPMVIDRYISLFDSLLEREKTGNEKSLKGVWISAVVIVVLMFTLCLWFL